MRAVCKVWVAASLRMKPAGVKTRVHSAEQGYEEGTAVAALHFLSHLGHFLVGSGVAVFVRNPLN